MKDWVEEQRKPPRILTFSLWTLALAGVMFLVGGAVLNYGPLFTVGGVCIGFAFGFYLSRQTMLDALKQVHGGRQRG